MTLKECEEEILDILPLIKLDVSPEIEETIKESTLEQFIIECVREYFIEYATINLDLSLQCKAKRNRTVVDLYRVCKFYFPHCSLQEVIFIVYDFIECEEIKTLYCNDAKGFTLFPKKDSRDYSFTHNIKNLNRYGSWTQLHDDYIKIHPTKIAEEYFKLKQIETE